MRIKSVGELSILSPIFIQMTCAEEKKNEKKNRETKIFG
jgi:hypothetical protein